MARNPVQSQIVASGVDLTSDPVQMPLNRAQSIVNFQIDRLGVLRTDLALANQLPTPSVKKIDGVWYYYSAFLHSLAPGQTPDMTSDLIMWMSQGILFLGKPNPDPLHLPVSFDFVSYIGSGNTGYVGTGSSFHGMRVRFASLLNEALIVQQGGLLMLRFYSTQALGAGFFRAGIEPPTNTGGGPFQIPALVLSAQSIGGVGIGPGTWNYVLTFADEQLRESSPTPPLAITLAGGDGTKAQYRTDYFRDSHRLDPNTADYSGSNIRYVFLYRDTQGAPGTYYQIARATIPQFPINPITFVNSNFYYNPTPRDYDDAPDNLINFAGSVTAPNPGENDPPAPASVICVWKNRVLLNNATNAAELQISNLLSATQFTILPDNPPIATDGARLAVGTDQGDPITAIVDFGSYAAIFKRRQVFYLSGNSLADWQIQPVFTRGCLSPDSAYRCDNAVCFLSDDGVYAASYDGGEAVQKISKEIEADLLSQTQADRESSTAWFVDNCYHLNVGKITYVYSFDVQGWTTYKFGSGFNFGGPDSGLDGSIVKNKGGGGGGGTTDTCSVTISPTSIAPVAAGESDSITITAANGADIGYTSSATWVHLTGGPTNGSGTLTVTVDVNSTGITRTATVGICGEVLSISQVGGPALANCGGTQGLIHWYKADAGAYTDSGVTLATTGQSVQQWNDQVGTAHLTQPTAVSRPVFTAGSKNGLPAIVFDGSNDFMNTVALTFHNGGSDGYEFFLVARLRSFPSCTLFSFFAGGFRYLTYIAGGSPDGLVDTGAGFDFGGITDTVPGGWAISDLGVGVPGFSDYFQVNQLPVVGTLGASHGNVIGLPLYMASLSTSEYAPLDVAEFLVYTCPLSVSERAQTVAYLNSKWAIY